MMGRAAPYAVVMLCFMTACYDDPTQPLRPGEERPSHMSSGPAASGIFNGAESFVAGNPMGNFAGGEPYNYGYYSTGPDSAGTYDPDKTRIDIPHDSLIAELADFSFEAWIRPSYSEGWNYGLIAMNSSRQYDVNGQNDFGYFLLDYFQYGSGVMEINWSVASYNWTGWSFVYAEAPTLHPDSGAELHVVGVHQADVISLYINGQLAASADISGHSGLWGPDDQATTGSGFRQDLTDIYSWRGDSIKPLMIGGAQFQEGNAEDYLSMAGSIGESSFYRRALSAQELQEHYLAGTATPPTNPDSLYDPYRDLVLSDSAVGYWRHREAELHGLPTIDGEQVVDASGSGWHGTYRASDGGATDPTFAVHAACTPDPVVRGEEATCMATWDPQAIPPGEITFEWEFQGDTVRPFPNGDTAYAPPAPVSEGGSGMATWSGPAVLSGRIVLSASWSGRTAADTTDLAVSPRPAFTGIPISFDTVYDHLVTNTTMPLDSQSSEPFAEGTGALGLNFDVESGVSHPAVIVNGTPALDQVPTGPNAGLWYVSGHNLSIDRGYAVRTWVSGHGDIGLFRYFGELLTNRELLAARLVDDRRGPDSRPMHPDSTEVYLGVKAHEGYGRDGMKGHQGQIELAARSVGICGNLPVILDPVVADDPVRLDTRVAFIMTEGRHAIGYTQSHRYVNLNYYQDPVYAIPDDIVTVNGSGLEPRRILDPYNDELGDRYDPTPGTGCARP